MSDLVLLAEIALAGALYVAGVRRVRRWPRARTAAFGAGLAVLVLALACSNGAQDEADLAAHRRLSAHMVQHLLLVFAAAPLLVAGSPVALVLRATRRGSRRTAGTVRAGVVLGHPLVGWIALPAVMAVTHFTGLYDAAVRDPALHAGEHVAYLLAAVAFWRPVLGADPVRRRPGPVGRLLYLLLAAGPLALVGVAMQASTRPWYAAYAGRPDALADQHTAGALMWVGGGLALAAVLLGVAWSAIEREPRRRLAYEEAMG